MTRTYSCAFLLLLAMQICSCSQTAENDPTILKSSSQVLKESNTHLLQQIAVILQAFKERLHDSYGSEALAVHYNRAKEFERNAENILQFLKAMESDIIHSKQYITNKGTMDAYFIRKKQADTLMNRLQAFKSYTLNLHPAIRKEFSASLHLLPKVMDSLLRPKKPAPYFTGISGPAAENLIEQIQAKVCNTMLNIITFEFEQIAYDTFTFDSMIVTQSSEVISANGFLEISAGYGHFTIPRELNIFINKQKVLTEESGLSHLKVKVPSRPGKYSIPVKMEFIDEDGKKQIWEKEVNYKIQ